MPPALPEVVDSISAEGSWSLLMSAATVQGHNARSFLSLPQERVTLLGFAHRTMRASHSHLLTRPWPGKFFPLAGERASAPLLCTEVYPRHSASNHNRGPKLLP